MKNLKKTPWHYRIIITLLFVSLSAHSQVKKKQSQTIIEISNAEELRDFARQVNAGENKNKTVVLNSDIFLNDTTGWQKWDNTAVNKKMWIPIGTRKCPFMGTFDGQNHTIYGLYINRKRGFCQGLFGVISDAAIKNLSVKASVVKGCQFVGGIIGCALSTSYYSNQNNIISNCHHSGKVMGGRNGIGGIIGLFFMNPFNSQITNCSNEGLVEGQNLVGGIMGGSYINVIGNEDNKKKLPGTAIYNCCNRGDISGFGNVGGIVGRHITESHKQLLADTLTNCYNTGTITARKWAGGIAGELLKITIHNQLENQIDLYIPFIFSNCYNAGVINCTYSHTHDNLVGRYITDTGSLPFIKLIGKNSSFCFTTCEKENKPSIINGELIVSPANIIWMEEKEMRTEAFVKRLNEYSQQHPGIYTWSIDSLNTNKGFPVFSKQKP